MLINPGLQIYLTRHFWERYYNEYEEAFSERLMKEIGGEMYKELMEENFLNLSSFDQRFTKCLRNTDFFDVLPLSYEFSL